MAVNSSLLSSYNGYLSSHDKIDRTEALELIKIAGNLNAQSRGGCCGSSSSAGDKELRSLLNENKFDDESSKLASYWLKHHRLPSDSDRSSSRPDRANRTDRTEPTDPNAPVNHGKVILDWTANKPTWTCPWWPMAPVIPGGDPINNLYAPGGCLDKYDQAFGKNGASRNHELSTHLSAVAWHGHCNNAAMVASTLREPMKDVEKNGVIFTPHDIKGLLCKVISSLVISEDMKGNRYNDARDNPYDPDPFVFLDDILKNWAKPGEPAIILDVDNTEQVWNFAFDKIKAYESEKVPAGLSAPMVPNGGKIKYYRFECTSTGNPERNQVYRGWIQYGNDGKALGRQWFAKEDPADKNCNPDFAWRCKPRGDLMNPGTWKTLDGEQDNPFISAQDVWGLYQASI